MNIYTKENFKQYEHGELLFRIREIIGHYIEGKQSGYDKWLLPKPSAKVDALNWKMQQMDDSWNRELNRSEGRSFSPLNLTHDLKELQQVALIDEIKQVKSLIKVESQYIGF